MSSWFWSKSRTGKLLESGLYLVEWLGLFGLTSGAAFALMFGKFLLAALLVGFALGVLARMFRRGKNKPSFNPTVKK